MEELKLSLTGQDVLNLVRTAALQRQEPAKIAQIYHLLRAGCNGSIQDDVQLQIEQLLLGIETKDRSLADLVREWVLSSSGVFLSSDVVKDLKLSSRSDIKNVSKVLERLRKEEVIDRHGEKRGCYRLRETDLDAIDVLKPTGKPLALRWPFLLEGLFVTLPHNIIIVAGEPDSGKSAFLFNFVRENMEAFDVHYFNSEMGDMELRSRLSRFPIPLEKWTKAHWWERSSNFADVIRPDAVNVIDYLEVTDEFWKIGTQIQQIHNHLRTGVAVIAIQKKKGADVGRGGHVTLEKPRLYLAMEPGKCRIIKCKNWRTDEVNPNGMELSFKLVKGCEFLVEKHWHKPEAPQPTRAKSYGDFVREARA